MELMRIDNSNKCVYRYDGGIDGFLTAIFDIYENKADSVVVTCSNEIQTALDANLQDVITDPAKAGRVEKGIIKNIGYEGFGNLLRVFSSCDGYKDTAIYNFLKIAFKEGRKVLQMLSNPHVIAYNEILNAVSYECHRMKGFVRFRETASGIMYAPIRPDNDILEFIMPHFKARFHIQKFAILDVGRKKLGVYDGQNTYVDYIDELPDIELTDLEISLQRVWKMYYDTVTIESRKSERRRKGFMPQRYWEFMPEIKNDIE